MTYFGLLEKAASSRAVRSGAGLAASAWPVGASGRPAHGFVGQAALLVLVCLRITLGGARTAGPADVTRIASGCSADACCDERPCAHVLGLLLCPDDLRIVRKASHDGGDIICGERIEQLDAEERDVVGAGILAGGE